MSTPLRLSMNVKDPAFERTQWIRASGAKITVKVDGKEISGAVMADEATGIVGRNPCADRYETTIRFGNFKFPEAVEFVKGKVEIEISLRD